MNKSLSNLKRWVDAQFIFTVIAVGLAALALFIAIRNEREVTLKSGATETEATAILERANDAVNFADTILSFLEGASVVVGAMLAVGAWMLRNSIQKQIQETRDFVERTEDRFNKREAELNTAQAAFSTRLDEMVTETRSTIQEVEREGRDSFRVLSMLVLAEQQVRAHNFDTAIRTLEASYDLAPNNHATNYLLGYLYTINKKFDTAIERLEHAIEREPDFAPAIAALGLALRRKGDSASQPEQNLLWSQAETRLLEALAIDERLTDPDGQSYYGTLGGLYRRQQRYNDAIDAYERARMVTPNSSYPISVLATLYTRAGNEPKAKEYYTKVMRSASLQLDDNPRDTWARADLAQAKLVLGDLEGAQEDFGLVIEYARNERVLLETVLSGVRVLKESPLPIQGVDAIIDMLEKAITRLDGASS